MEKNQTKCKQWMSILILNHRGELPLKTSCPKIFPHQSCSDREDSKLPNFYTNCNTKPAISPNVHTFKRYKEEKGQEMAQGAFFQFAKNCYAK